MTPTTPTTPFRLRAGTVAALAGLALAGCGRSTTIPAASSPPATASPYPRSTSTAAPAVPLPNPADVAGADADAVALAGVRALASWDTAVDADYNDTARRAVGWLSPEFAVQVRAYPPVRGPGAEWTGWAAHRAYAEVTTSPGGDDHPPDTATTAYRQVLVVVRPVGRDGWRGDPQRRTSFVTLALVDHRWRLAADQPSAS